MSANFHQCRLLAVNVCRRTKTIVILNYVQSFSYYFARLETDAAIKNVAKSNDFSSPLKNQQQTLTVCTGGAELWWAGGWIVSEGETIKQNEKSHTATQGSCWAQKKMLKTATVRCAIDIYCNNERWDGNDVDVTATTTS